MRTSTLARLLVAIIAVAMLGGEGRGQGQIVITNFDAAISGLPSGTPASVSTTVANTGIVTPVTLARGVGLTAASATGRFNASGVNETSLNSAVSNNDYFTWSLTPISGYALDLSSIGVTFQSSNTGATNANLLASGQAFTGANSLAFTTINQSTGTPSPPVTLSLEQSTLYRNLQSTTEFRLYVYGGGSGTTSVNALRANGLVSNRWSGAASADFAANGNWQSGSAPSTTTGIQFEGSSNTGVQINTDISTQGIRFASGASSFTLGGAGSITLNSAGGISNYSASQQTISNNLTLATNQNLFSSGGNLQIDGTISSVGTVSVTKQGTGTVTLSRGNLYTGNTSVNAGSLRVTNTIGSATSTGTVTVASSGTLQGTGAVSGLVNVQSGGTIRGDTAGNALSLGGGLTTQAGATIGVTLFSANSSGTAGGSTQGTLPNATSNTFIELTGGTTSISSTTRFTIDGTGLTFTPGDSYSYQILSGAGNQSALNITAQSLFTATGFDASPWTFSVTGTNAGAVYLNFAPVPEPATVLAVGAAGLGAISWLRRKRKAKAETAATA